MLGRLSWEAIPWNEPLPLLSGAVVGIVPTHSSQVQSTYEELRRLHCGVVPLVDGDREGQTKLAGLLNSSPPPRPAMWARSRR